MTQIEVDLEVVVNNKEALQYTEDAYLSDIELKQKYPNRVLLHDEVTDSSGYMIKQGTSVILAFRGTDNSKDWLTNLDCLHKEYAYGSKLMVHRGFYRAYLSIRDDVHEYIKSVCPKEIITCGHSLGGVLANLSALDIQYNFEGHRIQCFTFGAPRVGNNKFKKSYNKRVPDTIRTYINTDPVPHLPPFFIGAFSKGGYRHVGRPNKLKSKNFFIGVKNWIVGLLGATKGLADDLVTHSIYLYKKYI